MKKKVAKETFSEFANQKNAKHIKVLLNHGILDQLSEDNKIQILTQLNQYGQPILHVLADDFDMVLNMIKSISEQNRIKLINGADKFGNTLLLLFVNYSDRVKSLLDLLPKKDLLDAVSQINGKSNGVSVIDLAKSLSQSYDTFKVIQDKLQLDSYCTIYGPKLVFANRIQQADQKYISASIEL